MTIRNTSVKDLVISRSLKPCLVRYAGHGYGCSCACTWDGNRCRPVGESCITLLTWLSGCSAITGFLTGALAKASGEHPDVQVYAGFTARGAYPLGFLELPGRVGEALVGVALILGIFTGITAFFGSFMNLSYLLAGTVSVNPVLFVIATWLAAWKTAGWWGLDRWLLPALGTPWRAGLYFP